MNLKYSLLKSRETSIFAVQRINMDMLIMIQEQRFYCRFVDAAIMAVFFKRYIVVIKTFLYLFDIKTYLF